MPLKTFPILVVAVFWASMALAVEWTPPRSWETSVMGVQVKGMVQRKLNDIKGVLHIYQPLGKKLTYHFTGTVEGDQVRASHTDGHVFQGRITDDRKVEGLLTTKKGHRIPVKVPAP